jgi:hypothetical protein
MKFINPARERAAVTAWLAKLPAERAAAILAQFGVRDVRKLNHKQRVAAVAVIRRELRAGQVARAVARVDEAATDLRRTRHLEAEFADDLALREATARRREKREAEEREAEERAANAQREAAQAERDEYLRPFREAVAASESEERAASREVHRVEELHAPALAAWEASSQCSDTLECERQLTAHNEIKAARAVHTEAYRRYRRAYDALREAEIEFGEYDFG